MVAHRVGRRPGLPLGPPAAADGDQAGPGHILLEVRRIAMSMHAQANQTEPQFCHGEIPLEQEGFHPEAKTASRFFATALEASLLTLRTPLT